jgi:alkanesulfonate monooxygenase SsuD/methylene tetrahydromethanopterin reductase-like flavin-dependent oxidoreductase (luciferase family)
MMYLNDCGLMLEPQLGMTVAEIVEWAKFAEKSGYGYVLRSDHLLPTIQTEGMMDSPECWVTLGVIAASTRVVKFGPLVSPIGFRNPALLARMACTLHSFTNGRLVLGVGAGWFEDEYAAHGYEFPRFQVRKDEFVEAVKIIRPLTEGLRVDFQGKYYTSHTTCLPKPKGKIHLIIGCRSQEVTEIAAAYADEWNIFSPPLGVFRNLKESLDAKRADRKVEASVASPFIIGENQTDLEPRITQYSKLTGTRLTAEELRERGVLCGKVDDFRSQLNELIEAGVQRLYFQILNAKDKEMIDLLTGTLRHGI